MTLSFEKELSSPTFFEEKENELANEQESLLKKKYKLKRKIKE